MKQKYIITAILVAILSICLFQSCDKKPTDPDPEPEEHLFYIGSEFGGLVKIYSVEQDKFIDSLVVDSIPDDKIKSLHIIGDDSLMVATCEIGTFIVNLKTKEVVERFNAAKVTFSHDSKYYIYQNHATGNWELYNYPAHQLLYYDGPYVMFPQFGNNSKCLSYSYLDYDNGNWKGNSKLYDIISGSISEYHDYENVAIFWFSYPVKKYNKVFTAFDANYSLYSVGVVDFESDTLRVLRNYPLYKYFETSISLPIVSPDDKYIYTSAMMGTAFGGVPDYNIYVYDVETEDSVASISTKGIFNYTPDVYSITYDGKYLLVQQLHESGSEPLTHFCLIDSKNFDIIKVFDFGGRSRHISTKRN